MAKLDKRNYTKEQWQLIKIERKAQKQIRRSQKAAKRLVQEPPQYIEKAQIRQRHGTAFVLGNGTSRSPINVEDLTPIGNTYGCNALYRSFAPDYLIAVDVKMILENTYSALITGASEHNLIMCLLILLIIKKVKTAQLFLETGCVKQCL